MRAANPNPPSPPPCHPLENITWMGLLLHARMPGWGTLTVRNLAVVLQSGMISAEHANTRVEAFVYASGECLAGDGTRSFGRTAAEVDLLQHLQVCVSQWHSCMQQLLGCALAGLKGRFCAGYRVRCGEPPEAVHAHPCPSPCALIQRAAPPVEPGTVQDSSACGRIWVTTCGDVRPGINVWFPYHCGPVACISLKVLACPVMRRRIISMHLPASGALYRLTARRQHQPMP